jgi:hypothetical protein
VSTGANVSAESGRGERKPGFDARLAGRRAECDGGGLVPGTRYATRHEFTGTLTGEYYDEGDPPWRWYRMEQLTRKPDAFPFEAVWCESESLFLLGE